MKKKQVESPSGARVYMFFCDAVLIWTGKMRETERKKKKKLVRLHVCPGGQVGRLGMTVWSCAFVMKWARHKSARWQLTSAAAKPVSVCVCVCWLACLHVFCFF